MQFQYDGTIRRFLTQMVRMLSGFKWQDTSGKLYKVPVMYGDQSKQVASLIKDNSENKLPNAPRIAVYISDLELDRSRLADATFVSKVNVREREIVDGSYTMNQGMNYTVERLMPTPYKLTVKADLWTTNTNQKLQLLEQILVLFNPSLEIQASDNFFDWTSLSVVDLKSVSWSSRTIPQGTETELDIATMVFETPIWISAPSKVKKLGIVTEVITNIFDESLNPLGGPVVTTPGNFAIAVENGAATILPPEAPVYLNPMDSASPIEIPSTSTTWYQLINLLPNKFIGGVSQLFLSQPNGYEVVGTVALDPVDETVLRITYDKDTFPSNTLLISPAHPSPGYGCIDAIIDPLTIGPDAATYPNSKLNPVAGTRYLLINDIGNTNNVDGADAWKNTDGTDFIASMNDIIEWDGTTWHIILQPYTQSSLIYVTNLRTGIQYKWHESEWSISIDGYYERGQWKLIT